jgi:hypothetical protein
MEWLEKESACEYLKAGFGKSLRCRKECLTKRSHKFQFGRSAELMCRAEHSLMKGEAIC